MSKDHKWPDPGWYNVQYYGKREIRKDGYVYDLFGKCIGDSGYYSHVEKTPVAPPPTMVELILKQDSLYAEIAKLTAERDALRELVEAIDLTLRVPAAEYVPAIGDVFTLIDKAKGTDHAPST